MATINGKHGKIFECDDCGDQVGDETQDFYKAWEDAQASGFRYYGDNYHRCAGCADEFIRNNHGIQHKHPFGGYR